MDPVRMPTDQFRLQSVSKVADPEIVVVVDMGQNGAGDTVADTPWRPIVATIGVAAWILVSWDRAHRPLSNGTSLGCRGHRCSSRCLQKCDLGPISWRETPFRDRHRRQIWTISDVRYHFGTGSSSPTPLCNRRVFINKFESKTIISMYSLA